VQLPLVGGDADWLTDVPGDVRALGTRARLRASAAAHERRLRPTPRCATPATRPLLASATAAASHAAEDSSRPRATSAPGHGTAKRRHDRKTRAQTARSPRLDRWTHTGKGAPNGAVTTQDAAPAVSLTGGSREGWVPITIAPTTARFSRRKTREICSMAKQAMEQSSFDTGRESRPSVPPRRRRVRPVERPVGKEPVEGELESSHQRKISGGLGFV